MSVGVEPGTVRKSGKTGAHEDAAEAAKDLPKDMSDDLVDDEVETMRTPKFMRLRTSWTREEGMLMRQVFSECDTIIANTFGDAMAILGEIMDQIREPLTVDGEVQHDAAGKPIYRRNAYGGYVEDFTRLTQRQMSDYVGRITVRLFAWEQEAATLRGVALFSKAQFEERFAIAYDEPIGRVTVEGRQAIANSDAAEERYHAVFRTMVSHRADAVVRSMERLGQRLKDAIAG